MAGEKLYERKPYVRRPYPIAEPAFSRKPPEPPDLSSMDSSRDKSIAQKNYKTELQSYQSELAAHNLAHANWEDGLAKWENQENINEQQHNQREEFNFQNDPVRLGIERRFNAQKNFENTTAGQIYGVAGPGAGVLGMGAGALEGYLAGRGLWGAVNRFGVTPSNIGLFSPARAAMLLPYAGYLKSYLYGSDLLNRAKDENASPLEAAGNRAWGNFAQGQAVGGAGAGLFTALQGSGLSGMIRDLFQKEQTEQAQRSMPSINAPAGMKNADAVNALADFKGIDQEASKGKTWQKLQPLFENSSDAELAHVAKQLRLTGTSRAQILDQLKTIGTKAGNLGMLALAGMAGYEALAGGDSAEAGGMPTEGPSPGESLTQYRLRGLGLPSTPGEVANAASYLAPGIGEARLGYDIGSAGGAITHALMQGAPKSVTGNLPDPRLTAFHTWLDEQRQFQNHLDELGNHLDDMKSRYGGAPSSPGAALPTGGGMPGITGVPGAGGGSPPANVNPGAMPGGTPVGPSATAINPSTAAMLGLMMHGRRNAAAAALMGLGQ